MFTTEKISNEDNVKDESEEENDTLWNKCFTSFIPLSYLNQNVLNSDKYSSIKELKDIFTNLNNHKKSEEVEISDKLDYYIRSNPLFNIKKYKKRGKKISIQKNRQHVSYDFDNIQRKIQVHYLTFIINLCNDALKVEFGKKTSYNFKQIDYKLKILTNQKYVNELYSSTIKELLLKKNISPKIKNHSKPLNITTLEKVCKESNFIDKLFNMKYLEFFDKFYFNEGKLIEKINFEGKEIIFSEKTKPFYDLIKKNELHKNKYVEAAKIIYFYGYNSLIGINSFKIEKNINEIELKE